MKKKSKLVNAVVTIHIYSSRSLNTRFVFTEDQVVAEKRIDRDIPVLERFAEEAKKTKKPADGKGDTQEKGIDY